MAVIDSDSALAEVAIPGSETSSTNGMAIKPRRTSIGIRFPMMDMNPLLPGVPIVFQSAEDMQFWARRLAPFLEMV